MQFKNHLQRRYSGGLWNINNGLIIGDELAAKLNVRVGDSLYFSIPSEINIATNYLPINKLEIVNIFSFDIFEYDYTYAVLSIDKYKEISRFNNTLTYYDDTLDSENVPEINKSCEKCMYLNAGKDLI